MSGWSYPGAQIATWMIYGTRIQNFPGSFEGSTQETDAELQTFQSRPQCSSSDDKVPFNESKWEDIIANDYSHKYEYDDFSQILLENWSVTNIVVTEKHMVQLIGD